MIILLLFNVLQYFFSIDIVAYIKNLFTNKRELDIKVNETKVDDKPEVIPDNSNKNDYNKKEKTCNEPDSNYGTKQVFNIPGNYYNYDDAQTLCKAYNSRLATYDEVEDAYNTGGEWCNYGWSDKQMALFPTQKNTFNELQKIKGHEHDCGRPGVNGGYFNDPQLKFGANCFGIKPLPSASELEHLAATNLPAVFPITEEERIVTAKANALKLNNHLNVNVNSFNRQKWSRY